MSLTEPTFAGVPLSLYRQLPRGVTVTFAGAGGQAPIIGLTDPAALLGTQSNPANLQNPLGGNPGTDTFTRNTPLLNNANAGDSPLLSPNAGQANQPVGATTQTLSENSGPGKGKGKGKGKGNSGPGGGGPPGLQKHGGLPPGLAKKAEQGNSLPPGNPWSKALQTQHNTPPGNAPPTARPVGMNQAPNGTPMPTLQNFMQNAPTQPTEATTPQTIMGLPRPTVPLGLEPGPTLQLGPPFS